MSFLVTLRLCLLSLESCKEACPLTKLGRIKAPNCRGMEPYHWERRSVSNTAEIVAGPVRGSLDRCHLDRLHSVVEAIVCDDEGEKEKAGNQHIRGVGSHHVESPSWAAP